MRKLVCRFTPTATPSQIGSTPSASSTGAVIGMTMKTISNVSRMKPSTNMISMTTMVAPMAPPGMAERNSCTRLSPPIRRNTMEKTAAPIRMMKTIEVMVAVEMTVSFSTLRLNRRLNRASTMAPTEPTEAASVGVAMPTRMEPRTAMMRASAGTSATSTSRIRCCFSSSGTGVAGQDFGSVIALKIIQPI